MPKYPKFTINKKTDGRSKPWWFRVPSVVYSGKIDGKDKFFYFKSKKEAEDSAKLWRNKFRSSSLVTTYEGQDAIEDQYTKELIKKYEDKHNKSLTELLTIADKSIDSIKHHYNINQVIERLNNFQLTNVREGIIQPQTARDLNNYLTRQFATYQNFGETPVYEIDEELLEEFWQDEDTNRSRTYHRYLNQFFNYALERKYVLENPLFKFRGSSIPDEISVLTPDQGRLLLENGNERMIPTYILIGWCGVRKSECSRLTFADIDWFNKQIKVTAKNAKTKRKRFCDIAESPMQWLSKYDHMTGPIMPSNHYRMFREDRIKLGLFDDWERNMLRHSCGTYHVAHFRNKSLTQTLMGHKTMDMLDKHYDNGENKSLGLAWYNIKPSFNESQVSQEPQIKIN